MKILQLAFISCFAVISATACGARELSTQELAQVQALRQELQGVEADLQDAQARDAEVAGGLVKSLIAVRLEILKTNKALIAQRINALESGAKITVETVGAKPDEQEASRLATEIEANEAELRVARAEAERYGGLVGALKASTVATQEQTLAMLKQRYLFAKYGLTYPAAPPASTPTPTAKVDPAVPTPHLAQLSTAEGPFGFTAALSRTQIESMVGELLQSAPSGTYLYATKRVPKPHPSFESFVLLIAPNSGLCQVRAVGIDVQTSSHGLDLHQAFDVMQTALTNIYGPAKVVDQLLPGSIWNDPQDWMMALKKKERILQGHWQAQGSTTLRNAVKDIYLEARASDTDTGFLLLQYEFSNNSLCEDEVKRGEGNAL